MEKHGKIHPFIFALDVVGFALIFVGVGLIRYARAEVISILGGFVMAGGVAVLSLTRWVGK
ncbi:MAG: hypothetical protein Q8R53_05425 [Nanoarchaeota archaeon]|nr:hypothetical protein [Nanoarchaeota archaeon]